MEIIPGQAELVLSRRYDRTWIERQYSRAPLQWLGPLTSPFAPETATPLFYLRNPNGGLLDGDHHQITLELGAETALEIRSQGATRVHPGVAQQITQITLHPNSTLIWLPHPVIPGTDSRFQQHVTVTMAPSARLAYGEVWTAGRLGMGERWQFHHLVNEFQVWIQSDRSPLLWERTDLQAPHEQIQSPGVLGSWACWGSLYLLGDWSGVEWSLSATQWAVPIQDPRCSGQILRQVGNQAMAIWSVFRDTLAQGKW